MRLPVWNCLAANIRQWTGSGTFLATFLAAPDSSAFTELREGLFQRLAEQGTVVGKDHESGALFDRAFHLLAFAEPASDGDV